MDPWITPFPSRSSLVFWFGDLNFRIESYDLHFVKFAIDSDQLQQLWEKDQVGILHAPLPNPELNQYLRFLLLPSSVPPHLWMLQGPNCCSAFLDPHSSTWPRALGLS